MPFDPSVPCAVWAFSSPKGGPGKTTLAVSMSAELQRRAEGAVRLGDLDYTGNAVNHLTQGLEREEGIKVPAQHLAIHANDQRALGAKIMEMAKDAQFLILDTPGSIENKGAQTCIRVADIVIFPMSPSIYDYQATVQALELLDTVASINPAQLSVVVVNKPEKTKIDQQVQEALANYLADKRGVYLAKTIVRKAVGFKESAVTGVPLWSLGASGRNPASDIADLCDEILALQREHLNGR
jgi:cellulose biosynthesis protein BcsQ